MVPWFQGLHRASVQGKSRERVPKILDFPLSGGERGVRSRVACVRELHTMAQRRHSTTVSRRISYTAPTKFGWVKLDVDENFKHSLLEDELGSQSP